MKHLRFFLCVWLAPAAIVCAQDPLPASPAIEAEPAPILAPAELEKLLGPIALYPDALIALILPAATVPADVVLAARYFKERGSDLSQVEQRAWDDSVKSLTHYPEVLKWMDENLSWTKQVGEAFSRQPADVMNAVQRLRTQARAAGTLTDTPQQQTIVEQNIIRIVPADPEIIYVPYYDPAVVFVSHPVYYSRPLLTFGTGCRVGSWLAHDFDWHRSTLWIGDRRRHWSGRHDWRRPVIPLAAPTVVHAHDRGRVPRPWKPVARPTPVARPASVAAHHRPIIQSNLQPSATHPVSAPAEQRTASGRARPDRSVRQAPPINVQGVAPRPEVAIAPEPIPAPPLSYRSQAQQTPTHTRATPRTFENRGRTHQPPIATAPISAPALRSTPSAPRSFPTVVAPTTRGGMPRAAAPAPAPALQNVSPNPAPATTGPASAPAATPPAESSSRSSPAPHLRNRRS